MIQHEVEKTERKREHGRMEEGRRWIYLASPPFSPPGKLYGVLATGCCNWPALYSNDGSVGNTRSRGVSDPAFSTMILCNNKVCWYSGYPVYKYSCKDYEVIERRNLERERSRCIRQSYVEIAIV